jgi:hypothetical protein
MNWLPEGRHTLRLGTQDFIHMYFNLQSLLIITKNLDCLDEPFTKEKIDGIIMNLPSNKSCGSDGFNEDFLKKCWETVS